MIKEYALTKSELLERVTGLVSSEDLEKIKQLPDDVYLWPSGFDTKEQNETMDFNVSFEYERRPT